MRNFRYIVLNMLTVVFSDTNSVSKCSSSASLLTVVCFCLWYWWT